jgi:predicted transcriptional regulator
MTAKNAEKYMNKGGLLIVGDRGNIQKIALEAHNAVLVTGGLPVEQDILDLADQEGYPVMRSNFDTFTVASRINRILSNEIIRKDITTVGDIYDKTDSNNVLQETDTVKRYLELVKKTNVSRFPIVNKYNLVVGVIAMRDTAGKAPSTLVDKIMSRSAITAKQDETVASVSQKMLSDGLEMLPVVDNANKLLGTITKTNVMRSMREAQENAQFAHTFTDQLSNAVHEEQGYYAFKVEAMMMNNLGYISYGTLSEVASDITMRVINKTTTKNVMIEQMTIHFVEAVNIDDTLEVYPKIISESRLGATVDLEVYLDYKIVSKIIVTVRLQ